MNFSYANGGIKDTVMQHFSKIGVFSVLNVLCLGLVYL
jgi:hypothetical protein